MMKVVIDVRDQGAISLFQRAHKQFPFAASFALNLTATDFQEAMRSGVVKRFTIRRSQLLKAAFPHVLPRDRRSTKTRLQVDLNLTGIGTIFSPFETGERKYPSPRAVGPLAPYVIVPTKALRPSKKSIVPASMYPSALGLTPFKDPTGVYRYAHGSKGNLRGGRGTFALTPDMRIRPSQAGVYQRIGSDVRMIWSLRPSVARPAILGFLGTAQTVMALRFKPNWDRAWAYAMRTAK